MSNGINFSQYMAKKLSGLTGNNIQQSGYLSFNSQTQMSNYASMFDAASVDLEGMDYEAIIESLKNGTLDGIEGENNQNAAAMVNELLSIEGLKELADANGDGEITAEEVQALVDLIANADGDAKNLTAEDVDAILEQIGVNLEDSAENAVDEALKEIGETTPTQAPTNTGGTAPAGGGNRTDGTTTPRTGTDSTTSAEGESPEHIKERIAEKEAEIGDIEARADEKIAEKEKEKDQLLQKAGLTDEEIAQYKKQEQEIDNRVKSNETAIRTKDNQIKEYEATVSSNDHYISDLNKQIETNRSKMESLDPNNEKTSDKKAEINAQITNLENEKRAKEQQNAELAEQISKTRAAKAELEKQKETYETQKQQLNADAMKGAGIAAQKGGLMQAFTADLNTIDKEIAEIRETKNDNITRVNIDIKNLQVQLKDAEAAEERKSFIDDNKARIGLGLTGEELVDVAWQMLDVYGSSTGYCATGVHRTFEMAYGISLGGNGCDWTRNMDGLVEQGYFIEATSDYATSADLANLPAGAVVTWDNTGGTNGGGAQYGHVCIADGHGGEISDHHAENIYKRIGGSSTTYHVYILVE